MIDIIKKGLGENVRDTPGLVRKLAVSWLLAVVIEYLCLPGALRSLTTLDGLAQMSLLRVGILTAVLVFLLLFVPRMKHTGRVERWALTAVFGILAAASLAASFTWAYLTVCLLIMGIFVAFGICGWDGSPEPMPEPEKAHKAYVWITAILSAAFFLLVCAWTVGRVYSFAAPTYDFGIFAQMFHSMKETGLPMTTLERDGLLSHFDVHVSPIYYLMLPFYWLVPTPATLQVLQAAVITSAVIPLWLIAKNHGLSGLQRMLICGLLLALPAFSGGVGYDIHENCFLTPLILWLFYGIDKKNTVVTAVFAILTLMVKEDAAVYVAVIALWLIVKTLLRFQNLNWKDLVTGAALLAVSLVWFFGVTGYLAKSGDGVMTYRYDNFMYDGSSSLIAVVKSVLLNPMKAVFECVGAEKLKFILQTMVPLLGLPLLTRRYERYLLLIPYILVNLMSDYQYQHNIMFQYNFGSTAFLMYLTAVNLADLKLDQVRTAAAAAAVLVGAAAFWSWVYPTAKTYADRAYRYYDYYQNVRDTLAKIPEDASVTATTFYTTQLSQREIVYDLSYCSREHLLESEYVALQVNYEWSFRRYATGGKNNGYENLVNLLEKNGYELYASIDGVLVIYYKE